MPATHTPSVRRLPHVPNTPGRVPWSPEKPGSEDHPELEESESTPTKAPTDHKPEIDGPFKPDLGTGKEKEEAKKIVDDLKKKKRNRSEDRARKKAPTRH